MKLGGGEIAVGGDEVVKFLAGDPELYGGARQPILPIMGVLVEEW